MTRFYVFILSFFCVFSLSSQNKIAFTNLVEICENDTVIFRNNSSLQLGISIKQFAWDFDGDLTFDLMTTQDTVYHVYSTNFLAKYGVQRKYNVQLRVVTSQNDTLYSDQKEVKINYLPILTTTNLLSFDTLACQNQTVKFFNNFYVAEGTIYNTYWYFNNADETYTTDYFTRKFDNAGVYTVSILAVSDKYCKTRMQGKLRIKEIPSGIISYSSDTTFYNDKSINLSVTGDFSAVSWNTGETTPKISVNNSGVYSVQLYNEENCSVKLFSSKINVLIEKPLDAMNTLTLNNDGINELWKIYELEAYGNCKVKVYNSNGRIIYENTDYKNNWDAKVEGEYIPEGTYYYTVESNELTEIQKGTINVLH